MSVFAIQLPEKGHLADISKTGVESYYVLGSSKGLQVVSLMPDSGALTYAKSHLANKDVRCVTLVRPNQLLVGFFASADLLLYSLATSSPLATISNPSGDKYPQRITPLDQSSHVYLLSDSLGLSLLSIDNQVHVKVAECKGSKKGIAVVKTGQGYQILAGETNQDKRHMITFTL